MAGGSTALLNIIRAQCRMCGGDIFKYLPKSKMLEKRMWDGVSGGVTSSLEISQHCF